MAAKPTTAFVLGLVGGIFILVNAIAFTFLTAILTAIAGGGSGATDLLYGLHLLVWVSAFAVLVGSIMLLIKPAMHRTWGLLVLVFSLVSVAGGGGFFIGLVLGLVGGILALRHHPPATPPAV